MVSRLLNVKTTERTIFFYRASLLADALFLVFTDGRKKPPLTGKSFILELVIVDDVKAPIGGQENGNKFQQEPRF